MAEEKFVPLETELRARAQALLRLGAVVKEEDKRYHARKRKRVEARAQKLDLHPMPGGAAHDLDGGEIRGSLMTDDGDREDGRVKAKFWKVLGRQPVCGPHERWRAKLYHQALVAAMEGPQWLTWTRREREHVRQLELRWRRRASGEDVRFELFGNKRGALTQREKDRLRAASYGGMPV